MADFTGRPIPAHGTPARRRNHCCDCVPCVAAGRDASRREHLADHRRVVRAARDRAVVQMFPFAVLEDRVGLSSAALTRQLRISGTTLKRLRIEGLTLEQADQLATRAGFLPVEVWPEMELRTVAAAADELEVSVSTILRRIADGTIGAVQHRRGVRVPWPEVDRVRREGIPLTGYMRQRHSERQQSA